MQPPRAPVLEPPTPPFTAASAGNLSPPGSPSPRGRFAKGASSSASRPAPVYPKRRGYRHGYVVEAAVKRGLEVIAERGPTGLTLRGIARDLGIAPATVVYHFGNLEGLRQAVADEISARMAPHARMNARRDDTPARLVENGLRWVEFAVANPHWYAFAAGIEWRRRPHGGKDSRKGPGSWFASASTCLYTTRRSVGGGWGDRLRDAQPVLPDLASRAQLAGATAYAGIHGLAMARVEGLVAPEHAVPILIALAAVAAG